MTVDPTKTYKRCPVCKLIAETVPAGITGNLLWIDCIRCGKYFIERFVFGDLLSNPLTPRQIANVSGYIAENFELKIRDTDLEFLRQLTTPTVIERATRLLRCLADNQPNLGHSQDITDWLVMQRALAALERSETAQIPGGAFQKFGAWLPWLSATWSEDLAELSYLLESCLHDEFQYIKISVDHTSDGSKRTVTILPKGWKHLETTPRGGSDVCFVAMWFDDEVKDAWEQALYPAIRSAGYRPLRIDQKQHNGKIDDEIVASIRAAKFIIADFTGQRGGVYFEAGLAFGLNKQVIWTVRADHVADLHFDTRQFNHIVWKPDDLAGFRKALQLRIEATLGKGPVAPNAA